MSGDDESGQDAPRRGLDELLALARAHGQVTDTHGWVSDLEDMLRVAWALMTPEQQAQFRTDPEVLAIAEAAGEASGPAY